MKAEKNSFTLDDSGNIKKSSVPIERTKIKGKALDLNALNIGYYIITPLIAGVFLGLGLDHWLGTKPWLTGLGLAIGTMACFYNLIKLLRNA